MQENNDGFIHKLKNHGIMQPAPARCALICEHLYKSI